MTPVPKEIIAYEVSNSWICSKVSFGWGQRFLGWYFGRKCYRKWKRYQECAKVSEWIKENVTP